MDVLYRLNEVGIGESAIVWELQNRVAMRRRLRDMGLIEGTTVERIGKSPGGDPSAYLIRGTVIAIRDIDAQDILVKKELPKEGATWD